MSRIPGPLHKPAGPSQEWRALAKELDEEAPLVIHSADPADGASIRCNPPSGPYSYEVIRSRGDGLLEYRISNAADDRIATCYLRENAEEVVRLLNLGARCTCGRCPVHGEGE